MANQKRHTWQALVLASVAIGLIGAGAAQIMQTSEATGGIQDTVLLVLWILAGASAGAFLHGVCRDTTSRFWWLAGLTICMMTAVLGGPIGSSSYAMPHGIVAGLVAVSVGALIACFATEPAWQSGKRSADAAA